MTDVNYPSLLTFCVMLNAAFFSFLATLYGITQTCSQQLFFLAFSFYFHYYFLLTFIFTFYSHCFFWLFQTVVFLLLLVLKGAK